MIKPWRTAHVSFRDKTIIGIVVILWARIDERRKRLR